MANNLSLIRYTWHSASSAVVSSSRLRSELFLKIERTISPINFLVVACGSVRVLDVLQVHGGICLVDALLVQLSSSNLVSI